MKVMNPLFPAHATKFFREFCKPLHKFAMVNFMHDITFGKGQITMMVSSEDLFRFYNNNKIPTLCTDDTGRILDEGMYFNSLLETNYPECSILMPLMPKVGKNFGLNFGKNSIHIVSKENSCQHLYSLFFSLEENDFYHWILNNSFFLQDFIENYLRIAKDLILEAKAPESRIVLPNSNEVNFILENESTISKNCICVIHKDSNAPIHLSKQQSICFNLVMQGKTAKAIALEMKLSSRTVEKYIEILRNILGCSNSKELITSYGRQFFSKT